jgi:hypothetical protein
VKCLSYPDGEATNGMARYKLPKSTLAYLGRLGSGSALRSRPEMICIIHAVQPPKVSRPLVTHKQGFIHPIKRPMRDIYVVGSHQPFLLQLTSTWLYWFFMINSFKIDSIISWVRLVMFRLLLLFLPEATRANYSHTYVNTSIAPNAPDTKWIDQRGCDGRGDEVMPER